MTTKNGWDVFNESTDEILGVVGVLQEVLSVSFGPKGRAVLSTMANGSVTISRSSQLLIHSILDEAYENDRAMAKLFLDHLDSLYCAYGDGGACFLFLLQAMLQTSQQKTSIPRAQLAKHLEDLSIHLWSYNNQLESCISLLPLNELNQMVPSFFQTRFTSSVARVLSDRFLQWLQASSDTSHSITLKTVDYLIKHYSKLVIYFGFRSINESEIKNGFWIGRELICNKSSKRDILLLQVGESGCDNSYTDDDIKQTMEMLLQSTTNQTAYLIITSAILPELLKFRLRQRDIALLEGVSKEDIQFLASFPQLNEIEIIKMRLATDREGCNLMNVPIHQLVLYGPCMELTKQYAQACFDCLRLTRVRLLASEQVPVGGIFEQMLYYNLGGNRPPRKEGRQSLIEWHQQKQILFNQYSTLNSHIMALTRFIKDNIDEEIISVVLNGLWRFLSYLNNNNNSKIQTTISGLEPLTLRIGILQHALHSCATFIKIDKKINITQKLKRFSLNN